MSDWNERAQFVTIYISEAHPTGINHYLLILPDEWHLFKEICFSQPKSLVERIDLAKKFATEFKYPFPIFTDDPSTNKANEIFAAWPERIYVIEDKKVVYKGAIGPEGYKVDEVRQWLNERFN